MNTNPEFQRQLYLECSESRLIGIPLILATIFTFSYFLDDYRFANACGLTAAALFLSITLAWGARQTLDSINEEYRDQTWDTQRLSALGPWQMVWGKLFGSTIMVWYAGGICLLVYLTSHATQPLLIWPCLYAVSGALLIQSLGLLFGQLSVHQGQSKSGSMLFILLIGLFILSSWSRFSGFDYLPKQINWYSWTLDQRLFEVSSLLVAIFWSVVGNYRLMAQALGIRTLPLIWLAFALFLIAYLGGFLPDDDYPLALAAFLVCIGLSYIGVLVERHDAIRIKRLASYFQQQNWRRVSEDLPIWCVSFALAIPFALLLSVSDHPLRMLVGSFHFYPLTILLLLVRDTALYLFFCYGKNPQRALSLTLLWGALLYGILPGIFSFLGQIWLAALFFPLWAQSAGSALLCAVLQTGLLLSMLYRRWQDNV